MSDSTNVATPAPDFDAFGVPQTVATAKGMTKNAIRAAIVNVIAYLEETTTTAVAGWPAAPDGSVGVDSQLGVDVYNEFVGHLARTTLKLTDVEQEGWSSVAGLTEVLADAFSKMASNP